MSQGQEPPQPADSAQDHSQQQEVVSKEVECPPNVVGRVIGKGGEVIRAIQNITGIRVFLNQDLPPDQNRIVSLTGHRSGVDQAEQLVHEVMEQGARGASNVLAKAAGPTSQTVECPKQSIGRVIGRGGTTIKSLQTVSGARVQIDQSCEPCKITINGYDANVRHAAELIEEVLSGAPVDQLEQQANMIQQGLVPPPAAMPNPYDYSYMASYQMAAAPDPYAAYYGGYQYPPQWGGYPAQWGQYQQQPGRAQPYSQQQPYAPQQEWFSAIDPSSGRTYYYNVRTGVSQWEPPQ